MVRASTRPCFDRSKLKDDAIVQVCSASRVFRMAATLDCSCGVNPIAGQ